MTLNFTIIIPTYNRADILNKTLFSLTQHIKQCKFTCELYIVDNNSTDNTKDIALAYKECGFVNYLFEERQGKNFCLNTAINLAKGKTLIFVDDDIIPQENWLENIHQSIINWPDKDVFGGKVTPLFPSKTPAWVREGQFANFVYAIHSLEQAEGPYTGNITPTGPNCWVNKKVFDNGYYYDHNIGPQGKGRVSGSELEFFTRIAKAGYHPVYVPSAEVLHQIQPFQTTIKYLLKRSYSSGTGFAYIYGFGDVKRLFNIPRFLYGQVLKFFLLSLVKYITFNPREGFQLLMDMSHRLGCIKACKERKDS